MLGGAHALSGRGDLESRESWLYRVGGAIDRCARRGGGLSVPWRSSGRVIGGCIEGEWNGWFARAVDRVMSV